MEDFLKNMKLLSNIARGNYHRSILIYPVRAVFEKFAYRTIVLNSYFPLEEILHRRWPLRGQGSLFAV